MEEYLDPSWPSIFQGSWEGMVGQIPSVVFLAWTQILRLVVVLETMLLARKVTLTLLIHLSCFKSFVIALDQIITQLMEHSNASQPVPATEAIISDLPREVLEPGCVCCWSAMAIVGLRANVTTS
jgi:hypothetical protein